MKNEEQRKKRKRTEKTENNVIFVSSDDFTNISVF